MAKKDRKGRNLRTGESQRKDGSYMYRYTDKAGIRRCVYSWRLVDTDTTPPGKKDNVPLRVQEREIQRDLEDGILTDKRNITLNEMYEIYITSKSQLKDGTIMNYKSQYKKHVKNGLGRRRIRDIRYSDVKRMYNAMLDKENVQPSSLNSVNKILHPIFEIAKRDGLIRNNPTDHVITEIKKERNYTPQKKVSLTVEEQAAFIEFVKQSNTFKKWLNMFTFMLGTGCRVGEVTGLLWEDCDFKNDLIMIRHNLAYTNNEGQYRYHITTPKTDTGIRTIPMLNDVKKALLDERKNQMQRGHVPIEIDGCTGFVFTNYNGNVHARNNINKTLKFIIRAYNKQETQKAKRENREPVLLSHFTCHTLRHTFATRFCENETNLKAIQEIMGHADIQTTMNIYADATLEVKKVSIHNLEGKIKIS